LSGYLLLAQAQWHKPVEFARAWNFAPDNCIEATVGEIANALSDLWGDDAKVKVEKNQDAPYESSLLSLDSSLAHMHLGWQSRWSLLQALENTVEWYRSWQKKHDMHEYSLNQIKKYMYTG
jgi:CDP-glucose 4,6-dehydratase